MRFGIRELIFFAVLIAVPVASYLMAFEPRNRETEAMEQDITRKQAKLEELYEANNLLDDLELEITRLTEAIQRFEQKLPAKREVDRIVQQLYEITSANHLTITDLDPEKAEPAADYFELPMEVEIEGQFDGFYAFLLELEKMSRITRITEMELERKTDDTKSPLKVKLTLKVYYEGDRPQEEMRG